VWFKPIKPYIKTLGFNNIMEPQQINAIPQKQFDTLRYVVITPVRNESEYIGKTILSMIQQTIRPVEWIVVNDGSSDNTAEIVSRYSQDYPWIKLVNRTDRGTRQRGKGVVETFYTGYETLTQDYEVIVKLDGDLFFEPDFFQTLLNEFSVNPKLGIAGGAVYERLDGENWVLQAKKTMSGGQIKFIEEPALNLLAG
jgi:glycosyltransferase involved in cell wall biosynthesis